jgi:hypothetical protein
MKLPNNETFKTVLTNKDKVIVEKELRKQEKPCEVKCKANIIIDIYN